MTSQPPADASAPIPLPSDAPTPEPAGRPTAGGFVLRVLVYVLWAAVTALLIPLFQVQPILAIVVALLLGGIGRAVLGVHGSWLAIVAIPVSLGVAMTMILAPNMLTLLTGERAEFTVGEFSHGSRCTVHEVGGTRVYEEMGCSSGGERWDEGSVVELYVGGVLPLTMDDGTPWEADRLERNFSWVLPMAIVSLLGGLVLRIVKVWQTYWRPGRPARR